MLILLIVLLVVLIALLVTTFILAILYIRLHAKCQWIEKGSRCMCDSRDSMYRELCLVKNEKNEMIIAHRTDEARLMEIKKVLECK